MILDALLTFTGSGNGSSGGIISGQWVDSPTTGTQDATNIIDLGINSGIPSSARGGGARDISVGEPPMLKLAVEVVTAFVGGTSLQYQLQGAPDNGVGAPGTWYPFYTSQAIAEAFLTQGAQVGTIDIPRPATGTPLPRYLKMTFISVGVHTGGAIEGQIVMNRDDQIVGPTGAYSGYPAGINIPT